MAGEVIRQTIIIDMGCRLRDVEARKALVLTDSKATEVVTVLHAHKGFAAESPPWYDFSIASYNGDSWFIHCIGQVPRMAESETQRPLWETESAALKNLTRRLTPMRFCEAMARVRVVFGPDFRRFVDTTSSATDPPAEAQVVSLTPLENKRQFALHPMAINAYIQLRIVAAARGLCRNLDQLDVPVVVGNVEVFGGAINLRAQAYDFTQGMECVTEDSKLSLRISGL
jgi:hypothetical protein